MARWKRAKKRGGARISSGKHRDEIDGVIVTLPNFGEERAIADALRLSTSRCRCWCRPRPTARDMTIRDRRDSFCGKMSACNNLMQYGIPYSLTTLHTESPESRRLREGPGVVLCRLPGRARLKKSAHRRHRRAAGSFQHRSLQREDFWKRTGISVETLDLSEIFGRIERLKDTDDAVQAKLAAIKKYVSTERHSRSSAAEDGEAGRGDRRLDEETYCTITAVQCWTSMEEYFGVVPCTVMSMMSENLFPAPAKSTSAACWACTRCALASETPSALLDWNNNYGNDPDKAVCFHCSQSAQALL